MSFWTDIRDAYEQFQTAGVYNPQASRQNERDQRGLIQGQIKAYQDQTALTRQQLDQTRNEQNVEKRRIQEKQIRSLRGTYRAQNAGMLGVGQPATNDMNTKLGG